MILSHKIRLDLNNVQKSYFDRCAGTTRFTYNWGLAEWKRQYEAGEKPSWQKLNKELNAIKKIEFPWLCELSWAIPVFSLSNLGTAFENFFRRVKNGKKPGYPKFKKKGRCKESFCINGSELRFDKKRVKLPKFGWVRMYEVLRFPGRVISVHFSKPCYQYITICFAEEFVV